MASAPKARAKRIDASTSGMSHSILPAISKPLMPVKCMATMPAPMTAPPTSAGSPRGRVAARCSPAAVKKMAISRDAMVRAGSKAWSNGSL